MVEKLVSQLIVFLSHSIKLFCAQVCEHIIQSVNTETCRIKDEWEGLILSPSASKSGNGKGSDTYCYELLSMLIGLSQSDVGCAFLSEQETLVQNLFSLLHVGTIRLQLQVS